MAATTEAPPITLPAGQPYSDYVMYTHDSGLLEVMIPVEWTDTSSVVWDIDQGDVGPGIQASSDYEAYLTEWGTPGLFFGASNVLDYTIDEWLDGSGIADECTYRGRDDYDDGEYEGRSDTWVDCGPERSVFFDLAVRPYGSTDTLISFEFVLVTDADFDALDRALRTFRLLGDL